MKKIFETIVLSIFAVSVFSRDYSSLENMNSKILFSFNLDSVKQISFKTIESNYFQICNTIKRYHGCENKYYDFGVYEYEKNYFEIVQITNGYSVFTYLVSKSEKNYPKMLLIDMRTGDQIDISFEIQKGLICLSYNEHCGEFPITVKEIYYLDNEFSAKQSYEIEPLKVINVLSD